MSTIGILGGMGPQASNLLLHLLIENTPKFTVVRSDEDFPDIVLLNVSVPNFTENNQNQAIALKKLLSKLPILEEANCSINAIACNTAHLLLPQIKKRTNLQFLNMPNLVLQKAEEQGAKRVGLLASQATVSSDLYIPKQRVEMDLVKLPKNTQLTINDLIMKQIRGEIEINDRKKLLEIIETFIKNESLDFVILGCTELPVIVDNTHPKVLSSLHILADSLLEEYFMRK